MLKVVVVERSKKGEKFLRIIDSEKYFYEPCEIIFFGCGESLMIRNCFLKTQEVFVLLYLLEVTFSWSWSSSFVLYLNHYLFLGPKLVIRGALRWLQGDPVKIYGSLKAKERNWHNNKSVLDLKCNMYNSNV